VSEEASSQSPTTTTTSSSEAAEVENTDEVNDEAEDDFEVSVQVQDGDKPNQDVWIPVELGPDGSPQIASGFEGVAPPVNGMYNCTELGEGLYNCTIVAGPCKGDNLVTSDAMEIKNHIENLESNLCQSAGASGDIKPGVVFPDQVIDNVPEAPVAPATTESPASLDAEVTDVEDDSEDDDEEPEEPSPTFHTLTPDNLETASYQDICGTTPWKNKTFRDAQASPRSGRRMGGGDQFWNQFNRRGKIVNGERAEYGEWPWQVSLRQWRTATFLHKCGAALLSDTWAITAAHCVESVNPDELLLRMGEYDLNDEFDEPHPYQDRKVQIVASHPKFDPKTFEYDLALLRFYEPVKFQPNIIPVCVPDSDETLVGSRAWVTGWGRLYEDGPLPAVLQEVDLPIINNTECEAMYEKAGFREHIPGIFICAGYKEGGKDSCEGDSGGPMVVKMPNGKWKLAGVISWGIGCAKKNQPGVMTRISYYRDWINTIIKF